MCGDWPSSTIRLQFHATIRRHVAGELYTDKATLIKFRRQHKSNPDRKITFAERIEALIGCIICGLIMYISAHGFTQMLAF